MPLLLGAVLICAGCGAARPIFIQPDEPAADTGEMAVSPTNADAYYNYLISQIQRRQGDLDKAREAIKRAMEKDPASRFLPVELALIHIQQSNHRLALDVVEQLLADHPEDVEGLALFARINQGMKRMELAKEAYGKVLDHDPDRRRIYLLLGGLYMESGETDRAQDVYSRLTRRFPDNFAGHFYLGRIQAEKKMDSQAEASFLRALKIKPDLEEPRFELIALYRRTGQKDKIAPQYEALLKQHPESVRATAGYGLFLHRNGSGARAATLFKNLGRQSQEDSGVFRHLIRRYIEKKQYADAAVILTGMLPGTEKRSDVHYLIGVAYEGEKKIEAALEQFSKIRPGNRFYQDAAVHTAFIYQEQGRIEEGIAYLDEVIRHLPDKPEFQLYLGTFYEEKKAYEKAVTALKAGLAVDPDNAKLYFRLGVVYDKWGRKDDSIRSMKDVIRIDPDHGNALNYLGYTYADLGRNLDEAERLIRKALSLNPGDGYITDSLGWVYFKKGEFARALEFLEKAAGMVPEDPVILEHLGDAYVKTDQKTKALEAYRRAVARKKEDKGALEKKIQDLEKAEP
jgi:tetratricopeptide (TPR) repeat protein